MAPTTRIVGKKNKPDDDPREVYRFNTTAAPMTKAQRFAFGRWRDNTRPDALTIATIVSNVQRGTMVDLPVASFDLLDAGASRVERFYMDYPVTMANAVGSAPPRGEARAWAPLVASHPMRLITLTRFTMGSHSWFVVERGEVEPVPGRAAVDGNIASGVQVAVYSVEPAARKAFTQFVTEMQQGEDRLVAFPPTAQADAFGSTMTNERIAAGLALHWMEKHAAEERKREEERKAAEAAARAVEEQRERERREEEERKRRIAAGDVSVLDDQGLAARLRAKRAKGATS